MGLKRILAVFVAAIIVSVPSLSSADTPEAQADFQAGRGYRAAHQWGDAIRSYQAALRADPGLIRAYKDLGAVYYLAGYPQWALHEYDRYLTLAPEDEAARTFDDRLRASLGQAPAPLSSHPEGVFRPGFDLRVPLTWLMASAADVDKFYEVPFQSGGGYTGTNSGPGSALGGAAGVGLDYDFSNGFVAGADLLAVVRSYSVNNSVSYGGQLLGTETDTYAIAQFGLLLTPGWRFRLGQRWILESRLGLGFMGSGVAYGANVNYTAYGAGMGGTNSSETAESSGNGFVLWPELRCEYLFGASERFGLGASVGYLYGAPEAQKYTTPPPGVPVGTAVQYETASGSASKWSVSTQGLSFGLFATWHFQPLFW